MYIQTNTLCSHFLIDVLLPGEETSGKYAAMELDLDFEHQESREFSLIKAQS